MPGAVTRLLPLLVALFLPGAGWAAPGSRVMLVQARQVSLPAPFERTNLLDEVSQALKARSCPVVGSCRSGDCRSESRTAAATDLIWVDADYDRASFSCSLRVEVRSAGGELKFGGSYQGDTCPATDLVKNAKDTAAKLCAQLMAERPAPAAALAVGAGAAGTRGDVQPRSPPVGGVVLLGGGAVATGFGIYLWALHGSCAHEGRVGSEVRCGDRYDTRKIGLPLTVVGLLGVAGGAWLTWARGDTQVAVTPGQVLLSGRF